MKPMNITLALMAFAVAALVFTVVPESYAATQDLAATSMQAFSSFDPSCLIFGGLVTSKVLRDLQAKKGAVTKQARELQDKAHAEGRDLTEEESKTFEAYAAQIGKFNSAIDRETLLIAEEASAGTVHALEGARSEENLEKDGKRGFRTFGEFAQAVRAGSMPGKTPDERLLIGAAAPSTFGSEAVGSDGGFAVPPDFSTEIFTHSLTEDALLPYTDNNEIGANSMVFPKDETTPWGTDGVRAYWQSEASAATATKPKLSTTTLRLLKLMALVPLTDELLADTNALGSYLPGKVSDSIRWKINEAFLWGIGNGTPQGALQGNAAVVQTKDSGQATLTLTALNLANMIARLPMGGSYGRAIWLINNNVLPALFTLTLGNYPIYLPGAAPSVGGIQTNPYGTLLGRPLVVSQHAKSFTSQGDVNLLDLKYYRTITKAGGLQTATSMHLYFDADATAFRTTFRVDGQPKIINPINPANGSTTLSPFVQLAAR